MRPETRDHSLQSEIVRPEPDGSGRRRRWPWIAGGVVLAGIAAAVIVFLTHWPFTEQKITAEIQRHFPGPVHVQNFRKVYFPKPGCVAQGITVSGISGDPGRPMITAAALTIRADYSSILTVSKRIEIRADGLRVFIPPHHEGSDAVSGGDRGSKVTIDTFEANDAVLEVGREGKEPVRFKVHELKAGPIASDKEMRFRASLTNPLPRGELTADGRFGPWERSGAARIPLSGSYRLEQADLGVFSAVAGTLTSQGAFQGTLQRIAVDGWTKSPDFEIRSSGRRVSLGGRFRLEVNGLNGDVSLRDTAVSWGKTTVLVRGEIAGRPPERGKTVTVALAVQRGRIQDLMGLVMQSAPTMEGPVIFHGNAVLPQGNDKFIRRVQFTADFDIEKALFTSAPAQAGVDKLSERTRGEKDNDPERVLSYLKGHLVLRDGVTRFSNSIFAVPAAVANFGGTANMVTQQLNLAGQLRMQATLSQATTGFKSVLLKIVDPFFKDKKHHAGADVPVKMTGTFSHPRFGVALLKK